MSDALDDIALLAQCPHCKAFGWCVTKGGARSKLLHATRLEPVRLAWLRGYQTGEAETLRSVPALRQAAS